MTRYGFKCIWQALVGMALMLVLVPLARLAGWFDRKGVPMTTDRLEEASRRVKADKLADVLVLLGADEVRLMSNQEWGWAADDAKVKLPVSRAIKDLVVEIVEMREGRLN
jgi:hypothetical protein